MGDKEIDTSQSPLIDNEGESSTDEESSKPNEDVRSPLVSFVSHIKLKSTSSDDKEILADSDITSDQTKNDFPVRNFFHVEPLLFLMILALSGSSVCNKTLYLDKACSVHLNYSLEVCKNLTFYKTENDEAEKVANNFTLYSNLISLIPAAVLTVFIGSWSDKYGRKKPVLVAFLGLVCQDILLLLNSHYMQWPMSYLLLTALPTGLTGSIIAINTCVYSFASEKTVTKMRTFKYAILELVISAAMPTGTFVGGRLYQAWSYMPVYTLALTAHAIAFLYTAVTMKDVRGTTGHSFKVLVSEFFSLTGLKENVRTCMQLRENNMRAQIGLLIGSICVLLLGFTALHDITFYFCEKMYGWSMTHYSDISTICSVATIIVLVIAVPLLTKIIRVQDALLGILGSLSILGQTLIRSFAYEEWIYYTAMAVGCFYAFGPLAVRSRISKIVSADELGKVFSVISSCESLVPIFGSLIFLQIYNASVESFPGMAYLCGAFFMVIPLISFLFIHRWQRLNYQSMASGIDAAASTSVQ